MEKLLAYKPLKIPYGTKGKTLDLKNRLMVPPMCSYICIAEDGCVDDIHLIRYGQWAMGGFGSIIMEATAIEPDGRISRRDLGLWNDKQEKALARLMKALHKDYFKGLKIGVQIAHAGRKCSSDVPYAPFFGKHIPKTNGGFEARAPSAIPFIPKKTQIPKELSVKEIKELVKKFADACERAKNAGADFVEIHSAHGYLLNSFLCQSTNKRTDEYGGSFENRTRILLEVVDAVFKRLGEFPVFVRLSCDEGERRKKKDDEEYNKKIDEENKKRWTIDDTIKLTIILKKKGVCLIDCSSGSVVCDQDWSYAKKGFQVPYSEALKKEFGDTIKTSCVGMIYDSKSVEKILKEGKADIVMLGRQAIKNPITPISHSLDQRVNTKDFCSVYPMFHGYALERLYSRSPLYEDEKKK